MAVVIRLASAADAAAVQAIYAPYVRETAISFETEPPTVEEMGRRIRAILEHAPWLVCERDGAMVGYAYAGRFHARAAYRWSVELTVYVDQAQRRNGLGLALYTALLDALRLQGFRVAIGTITVPNPASVGLHERLGFQRAALLPAIGFKHGRWHDVGWWSLDLQQLADPPDEPRSLTDLVETDAWRACLARAAAAVAR